MNEFHLIIGMFLVTFGVRYPVLAFASKFQLPKFVLRALNYVPSAVLTAIIIPSVLITEEKLTISLTNAPLFASIISLIISKKFNNLLLTIILGMLSFWLWNLVF